MNIPKLVSFARSNHISPRKLIRRIEQAKTVAADRGAMVALLESIHNETGYRNELAKMRRAERLLEHTTRRDNGKEFKGYANSRECSSCEPYTMGHARGSESLVPSDSFEACALAGMSKAEDASRHVADNN